MICDCLSAELVLAVMAVVLVAGAVALACSRW
jgi:hypothetical protein